MKSIWNTPGKMLAFIAAFVPLLLGGCADQAVLAKQTKWKAELAKAREDVAKATVEAKAAERGAAQAHHYFGGGTERFDRIAAIKKAELKIATDHLKSVEKELAKADKEAEKDHDARINVRDAVLANIDERVDLPGRGTGGLPAMTGGHTPTVIAPPAPTMSPPTHAH